LDHSLERPLDPEKAKEYDREHWGMQRSDSDLKSSLWDDATYSE